MHASKSAHCCFEATVMDTKFPEIIDGKIYEDKNGKHYKTVCECFELSDAVMIAEFLNKADLWS